MPAEKIQPEPGDPVAWVWTTLTEVVLNHESTPFTDWCAERAAELVRTFEFQPPMGGWITVDFGDDDESDAGDG